MPTSQSSMQQWLISDSVQIHYTFGHFFGHLFGHCSPCSNSVIHSTCCFDVLCPPSHHIRRGEVLKNGTRDFTILGQKGTHDTSSHTSFSKIVIWFKIIVRISKNVGEGMEYLVSFTLYHKREYPQYTIF